MKGVNAAKAVSARSTINVLLRVMAVMSMAASIGHAYAATTCPTSEQVTSTDQHE